MIAALLCLAKRRGNGPETMVGLAANTVLQQHMCIMIDALI
jgi:hypothetical protein